MLVSFYCFYFLWSCGEKGESGIIALIEEIGLTDTPALAGDTISFLAEGTRKWLNARYVSAQWDMEEFVGKEKEIIEGKRLKMRMVL